MCIVNGKAAADIETSATGISIYLKKPRLCIPVDLLAINKRAIKANIEKRMCTINTEYGAPPNFKTK